MSRGYFVTGTDTGVGKTVVACALLASFAASGLRAVGMKPVAAGAERDAQGFKHADVEQLIAAGNVAARRDLVNPYCFAPPVAPHIAAAKAGVAIELERLARCFEELSAMADAVIVEGVGGFRVPLGRRIDTATLAAHLALPVVLVVGMRLGCLNHALLTCEAIGSRGLTLAGWVANHIDPDMLAAEENVHALTTELPAPLLARIRYAAPPDIRTIASLLDRVALNQSAWPRA
jgi:dethiobiotin synthetase